MKKKKYLNKYSRENNYKKFTTLTYITCFIMVLFYNNWLFCNEFNSKYKWRYCFKGSW